MNLSTIKWAVIYHIKRLHGSSNVLNRQWKKKSILKKSLNSPIALCNGFPVSLSQTTIVSRWFVMPTAAISLFLYTFGMVLSNFWTASVAHVRIIFKMSNGSCSTHRSCGWICFTSSSCEHNSSNCGWVLKIYGENKWFFEIPHEFRNISTIVGVSSTKLARAMNFVAQWDWDLIPNTEKCSWMKWELFANFLRWQIP